MAAPGQENDRVVQHEEQDDDNENAVQPAAQHEQDDDNENAVQPAVQHEEQEKSSSDNSDSDSSDDEEPPVVLLDIDEVEAKQKKKGSKFSGLFYVKHEQVGLDQTKNGMRQWITDSCGIKIDEPKDCAFKVVDGSTACVFRVLGKKRKSAKELKEGTRGKVSRVEQKNGNTNIAAKVLERVRLE